MGGLQFGGEHFVQVLVAEYEQVVVGQVEFEVELDGGEHFELQVHEVFSELVLNIIKRFGATSVLGHFAVIVVELDEVEVFHVGVVDFAGQEQTQSREHVPVELGEGVLFLVHVEYSECRPAHMTLYLEVFRHLLHKRDAFGYQLQFFLFGYAGFGIGGGQVVFEHKQLHILILHKTQINSLILSEVNH